MWWHNSAVALSAFAVMAGLGLAGCGFQPLYGSNATTASGAKLSETMASVDITPIPGRVGQKVRNELIFANTGGGYGAAPKYKLNIALRERVINQLVQITGDARGEVYELEARYKLIDNSNGQVLHIGSAVSRAPYTRYQEIFANVRARYDAENRAARTVSDSIKTQVAAFLASSA
jgi:LPS-assembly lipoprotein